MKRVELDWLKVEPSEGSWFRMSPSETAPVLLVSSAAVSEVIGEGESRLGRAMREPVTTICSPGSALSTRASATPCAAVPVAPMLYAWAELTPASAVAASKA